MTRWRWILLISELLLFALILVLPQVDLPDTTFRERTAPIVVRMQLNCPPVIAAFVGLHAILSPERLQGFVLSTASFTYGLNAADRRLFLCILLC